MRVVDYIIDFVYQKGAKTIFTLAGGGAMFLNDAVVCHKKIKFVCNHHEQACAMAAEAYAKTNGKIGAAMVTSGPGSTNAISGLLEAYQNAIPVIFLSSQAKKSQMVNFSPVKNLRQIGIQEVNIIPIVEPLTKYAVSIEHAEDVRFHLEKAYYLATTGRPGPVWLDIPSDVAASTIKPTNLKRFNNKQKPLTTKVTDKQLNKLIDLLKQSKKPLIIAGGGIRLAQAVKEFRQLINQLKIPVVTPAMGIDLLEFDNPYYAGHGGTKGQRNANIIIQNSDLILVIGSRLAVSFTGHEYDKFAPEAHKVVVDIDPQEHQKQTVKIDYFIESDAKYFIKELISKIKNLKFNFKNNWLKDCQYIKERYASFYPQAKDKKRISMYEAIDSISRFSRPGDHFIFDAGITAYVCTQVLKIKKNQRAIIPGATLTMGYNLPAIIGIWAANPKSNIICITGDGSLQLNIHELATILHHKIPAKIIVLNNQGYLAIRTTQKNFFNSRFIGEGKTSGLTLPDTKKIAYAYGINFLRIKNKSELKKIIPKVLSFKRTVICEIMTPYWQDIITVSSKKLPNGKMISLPIDDMAPFLPEKEMQQIRKKLS